IAVTVYNPIARPVEHYIRVPVVDAKYEVLDAKGQAVKSLAILPVSDDVRKLPERNGSLGTHELVFSGQIPALGFTTYFVEKQKAIIDTHTMDNNQQAQAPIDMKGKSFTLHINETTGAIESITVNGATHKLRQSFKWYKSVGNQPPLEDSGSYNFCPDGNARDYGTQKLVARHTSGGVHELSQVFADYIHQTVRTYEDRDYIEFDWTVGGIPIVDKIGKEIVTRFESDLKSDGVYYTDANGRQTIRRKFNPQAKICGNNVIAANWFPIYSHVAVKDEKQGLALTVLNDRTQGGSSLMDGSVELMVHRRLQYSGAGSGLVLNETGIDGKGLEVRGKHYLFLQPIAQSPRLVRRLSEQLFMGPIETFATYKTREEYSGEYSTSFSGVGDQLPESARLLTLEKWSDREVLVRFEHMYEKADNVSDLSNDVSFDMRKVLKTIKMVNSVEMNLAANELLSETKRMEWRSKQSAQGFDISGTGAQEDDFVVKLSPQQIRTYIVTIEPDYHVEPKCTHSWVEATQTTIPTGAYVGGYDVDKTPLNVCRFKINNELIAGKADKLIGCVVTVSRKEHSVKGAEKFEVLVAKDAEWVPRHGEDPIPVGAILVGNKGKPNTNTYIGRCDRFGAEMVGKIDYNFYYGYKGDERNDCTNHEILVCV
ncbi:unnamed protein product, partial [Oppiella nova]